MSFVCELAVPFVANSAVGGHQVARPLRSHTSTCLRCQARHAAMSRSARELKSMAGQRTAAPADLEWRVISSLDGGLEVGRTWARPLAWTAALASMAAAVLIWRLKPKGA